MYDHLQHLGKDVSIPDSPNVETLDAIEFVSTVKGGEEERCDCTLTLEVEDFTSLCPVTGQPDHGALRIDYIPDGRIIETKSLKLYLQAYRNARTFVEHAVRDIRDDLFSVLRPKYINITGIFTSRGGIKTKLILSRSK